MNADHHHLGMDARELRFELEELYAAYVGCLDELRLEEWPDFFTEPCVYKIMPRENFERGLPLGTWLCESKGYLLDRVVAMRRTAVYAPRYIRRIVSSIRVLGWEGEVLKTRANFLALESLQDELTRVFSTGQYYDALVVDNGRFRFREKICVFDGSLVPNSLIYPL